MINLPSSRLFLVCVANAYANMWEYESGWYTPLSFYKNTEIWAQAQYSLDFMKTKPRIFLAYS